eukprot:7658739-Pyramimonas_sp.AAC.1
MGCSTASTPAPSPREGCDPHLAREGVCEEHHDAWSRPHSQAPCDPSRSHHRCSSPVHRTTPTLHLARTSCVHHSWTSFNASSSTWPSPCAAAAAIM